MVFATRKNLATESKSITDDRIFFLNRINFPTTREIYQILICQTLKSKAYYLHNKLMWVEAGIKEINETIFNLKNDFEDLIRQRGIGCRNEE